MNVHNPHGLIVGYVAQDEDGTWTANPLGAGWLTSRYTDAEGARGAVQNLTTGWGAWDLTPATAWRMDGIEKVARTLMSMGA